MRHFRLQLFQSCHRADQDRGTSGTLHYAFPEETVLPNIGDRVFKPNMHPEVHEEDVEFWWYPNLPGEANKKAMHSLKKKVERSRCGIEIWYQETESREVDESVGIKDIFNKTPSDIIYLALDMLGKVRDSVHVSLFISEGESGRFHSASGRKTGFHHPKHPHSAVRGEQGGLRAFKHPLFSTFARASRITATRCCCYGGKTRCSLSTRRRPSCSR